MQIDLRLSKFVTDWFDGSSCHVKSIFSSDEATCILIIQQWNMASTIKNDIQITIQQLDAILDTFVDVPVWEQHFTFAPINAA